MLLEVNSVSKSYQIFKGVFSKKTQQVLKNVSFFMKEGECLGIIGESGSGKSTLGRLILQLEKPDRGEIKFFGNNNRTVYEKKISIVFQNYTSSVNPYFKVLSIISEPLLQATLSKKQRYQKTISLLQEVGLDERFMYRYPHELSGGQLQRICIARAIAANAKFLVLDEAVSSLDASVRIQILDLLIKLKKSQNLSYLFFTHDLLTITYICDRVFFFKEGEIVEKVHDIKLLKNVTNKYSQSLLGIYQ